MNEKDQVIRIKKVIHISGVCRTRLYELMADGAFPLQFKLGEGARAVGWSENEVQEWVNKRIMSRDEARCVSNGCQ